MITREIKNKYARSIFSNYFNFGIMAEIWFDTLALG